MSWQSGSELSRARPMLQPMTFSATSAFDPSTSFFRARGDRADDVVRQDGGRAPDQFEDRFEEVRFRRDTFNRLRGRAHAVLREGKFI